MLVQCWASVEENGTTLYQYWLNTSCLLGYIHYTQLLVCHQPTCKYNSLSVHQTEVYVQALIDDYSSAHH